MAQAEERLLCKHQALSSNTSPTTKKSDGCLVYSCPGSHARAVDVTHQHKKGLFPNLLNKE
jgi:hypothetical protein